MTGNAVALVFALALTSLFLGPTTVWFFYMRPCIRKNGKNTATGANWFYSQLLDFSTILTICREKPQRLPWFMYV